MSEIDWTASLSTLVENGVLTSPMIEHLTREQAEKKETGMNKADSEQIENMMVSARVAFRDLQENLKLTVSVMEDVGFLLDELRDYAYRKNQEEYEAWRGKEAWGRKHER